MITNGKEGTARLASALRPGARCIRYVTVLVLAGRLTAFCGSGGWIEFRTPAGGENDTWRKNYESDWIYADVGASFVKAIIHPPRVVRECKDGYDLDHTTYNWSGHVAPYGGSHKHSDIAHLDTSTKGAYGITLSAVDHFVCNGCSADVAKTIPSKTANFLIVDPFNIMKAQSTSASAQTVNDINGAGATVHDRSMAASPDGVKPWRFSKYGVEPYDGSPDSKSNMGLGNANNLLRPGSIALSPEVQPLLGNPPAGESLWLVKSGHADVYIGSFQDSTAKSKPGARIRQYRIDIWSPNAGDINHFDPYLAAGWQLTVRAGINPLPYPIIIPTGPGISNPGEPFHRS